MFKIKKVMASVIAVAAMAVGVGSIQEIPPLLFLFV